MLEAISPRRNRATPLAPGARAFHRAYRAGNSSKRLDTAAQVFVHDWANPESTFRSWDMVARYVVPQINGYLAGLRKSQKFVIENRAVLERSHEAVMVKIMENEYAAAALAVTKSPDF